MENVEVLYLLLSRLDSRDLAMACCCCRVWRDVGSSDFLWRFLCLERWPGCEKNDGLKAIRAMGGYRVFFTRRVLAMHRPSKKLLPRPWLRLEHLTFFVDLTYKGVPVLSEAVPGIILREGLFFGLSINPRVLTDAILPRHALTPSFYRGQLFYETPFQAVHASEYWLNWSVVRSTDNRMACLMHAAPVADGELLWEQEGVADEGDELCLPLLFQAEMSAGGEGNWPGVLQKRAPMVLYASLECRPVWGDSLSEPMRFRLEELQFRVCKRNEGYAPPLDCVLLTLQQLDWK